MENSLKGLLLAAGTIITCVVISLGFYIAREAKDTASNGAGQINKLNSEFAEADKTIYDGVEVSGNEVINVIRKFENEPISVIVKNNICEDKLYYIRNLTEGDTKLGEATTLSYKAAQNETSESYINPIGRFQGSVLRDDNGMIIGIAFVQK